MLDDLVERRIREALGRGEFDNLPGMGKPLADEDDALVPSELRVANRILKNAGLVPPEVDALRNLNTISQQSRLATNPDGELAARARRRLLALRLVLERSGITLSATATIKYQQALLTKLQESTSKSAAPAQHTDAMPRHE